eukprot:11201891-Lingulodinium_polyedra.AAC.1
MASADGSAPAPEASAVTPSWATMIVPEHGSGAAVADIPMPLTYCLSVPTDRCMHLQHRTSSLKD